MIRIRRIVMGAAAVGLVLWSLPGAVCGQVAVTSGGDKVVVEGDYVRVEDPDDTVEISGDWRTAGSVRVTDDVLVQLGAVEGDDYVRLSLAGDVLFEFGSAKVTGASQKVLGQVAQVIRDRARGEVLIVGHTDSVGDDASNLRLSRERAAEVISWLHRHEGIPTSLLVGRGMGESQPVAHNTTPDGSDDPEGRARNRRVEIFVGTTASADVRSAAMITVRTAEGDVHIHEDRVEVGGVTVDTTGTGAVRVGGVSAGAGGGNVTCSAGKHCNADCPDGGCQMVCSAGAVCNYDCSGGNCTMQCAAGGTCQFTCDGGNCRFSCAMGANCKKSCKGGDCSG